ncbi:hypothetical protein NC653_003259 [Populus alba x Populus x berolinensis]|uniref:Malectin domain-containing protein n=2 Tax=Populus TaxID=3689 RepID=A0A4U5QCX2_POPAL|nr:hypothetical protein NC653_003259 [Populus alba x Populus x berolinensis]TKS08072.1 hypothetical protein D5086_0000107220 [Populus alba]
MSPGISFSNWANLCHSDRVRRISQTGSGLLSLAIFALVYPIKEKTVLTDFDIFKAAKGADNIFIKEIKAFVRSGALEIRFHWDGKGTTAIPVLEYMAQSTKSAGDVESGKLFLFDICACFCYHAWRRLT